jgi:hypothetical protein
VASNGVNLAYNTDIGYGIRVKKHDAEGGRPSGYVVEIHFYDKDKAVDYASVLIRAAQQEAKTATG